MSFGALWSGACVNETAWAGGEGEEAVLKRGEKRVGLIRALSKLRAAVCLLPKRGPRKSQNYVAPVRSRD